MPEAVAACPLCRHDHWTQFDQRKFIGYPVVNVLCSNCSLVFQTPRMTIQELEAFYKDQYREMYQGTTGPNEHDLKIQKARAAHLLKFLKDMGIEDVERFLDIGSSSGLLMTKVQEIYDCQSVGIEPGAAYRDYARSHGLEIYEDLPQLLGAEQQRFDLVSLIHVLEHIPDPVGYLDELRKDLLSNEGKLLIEVPNLYAHDCFEVAHLTSFSQMTLTQVVKKAGFRIRHIERHGFPRSKLIPLYITALAESSTPGVGQTIVEADTRVRNRRQAGFLHRRIIERLFPSQAWIPEYRS